MIAWRSVTAGGFRDATFTLEPGAVCRLLLVSAADLELFLRLLTGAARPAEGEVLLFGTDLAQAGEEELLALLARTGIVWPGGGFVSNLKTWENIMLPLWYHQGAHPETREDEVIGLLERLGVLPDRIPAFLASLPGRLPPREQRILGVARAMMQNADAMIYAGVLDGLDPPTRALVLEEAARHRARRAGRVALFVAAGAQGLPEPFDGASLRQDLEGGIVPWD